MEEKHNVPELDEKNEQLISSLLEQSYGVVNNYFAPELVSNLRRILLEKRKTGEMHSARIGKNFHSQKNLEIRGDTICWIDKATKDPFEMEFLRTIENFISYLNRTCYTSINDYEFHYAYYETGSFYRRHKDQFKNDQGRKFSLVTYLNDDWQYDNDGKLILYLEESIEAFILPEGGKVVFFKSDEIEHEVLPATRPRFSIAGWLKNS